MCGREEGDGAVGTAGLGEPFLPQQGLTGPGPVALGRRPCPLPAAATPGPLPAAALGLHGCVHPRGAAGAEGDSLCRVPKNRGVQKPVSCLARCTHRFGRRNPGSRFLRRFPVPAPPPGSPRQHSLAGWAHQSQKRAGKRGERLHCQPHRTHLVSRASWSLPPPRLFLPLLAQVTPQPAPRGFPGEAESLWDPSFSRQGAEQSRLSCGPAPRRVVLSTL